MTHPKAGETSGPSTPPALAAHEDRVGKIGSSDIAAVLGRNPYCSPLMAWRRITGRETVAENKDMRRGKILEQPIAELYALETGARLATTFRIAHPKLPWLIATIDRVAFREGELPWLVEIKSPRTLSAWRKGVPDMYVAQVQHQLGLALLRGSLLVDDEHEEPYNSGELNTQADVVAHCGDSKIFQIDYDETHLERMWNKVVDWHEEFIVRDTPPPEGGIDSADVIPSREVSEDVAILVTALAQLKKRKDDIEAQEDVLSDCIKEEFGPYQALQHHGVLLATFKPTLTRRVDVKRLRSLYPDIAAKLEVPSTHYTLLLK